MKSADNLFDKYRSQADIATTYWAKQIVLTLPQAAQFLEYPESTLFP